MASAPASVHAHMGPPKGRRRALAAAVSVGLMVSGASCSTSDGETLTIGVAASLADVAPLLADAYEEANLNYSVDITIAGSATLVSQAVAGAPYDVIVVADQQSLIQLHAGGLVFDSLAIASNSIVLAAAEQPAPGVDASDHWLVARVHRTPALRARCGRAESSHGTPGGIRHPAR